MAVKKPFFKQSVRKAVDDGGVNSRLSNYGFRLSSRTNSQKKEPAVDNWGKWNPWQNKESKNEYRLLGLTAGIPCSHHKDQLYRICHISKRKATWLLENGIIPCRDSGKKTRRFQIYTADVVNYLITLENEPQKVAIPVGIFTSNKYRKKRENPVAHLPRSELKKHLCLKWRSEPDALTITQISKITGYNMQTVGQWISKGKLQYVSCPDGRKVAKRWLIQFMTDYILASPYRLSYTMRRIMEDLDG